MKCPHCKTEIDEHEANRCLRGWVAESVMGWRVENGEDGLPAHAFPSENEHVYLLPDLGPQWYPDRDIAAAWEVVGRMPPITISAPGAPVAGGEYKNLSPDWDVEFPELPNHGAWNAQGDTAPLAICRAALKAA